MAVLQLIIDALKAKRGAKEFETAATKVTKSSKKADKNVKKLDKSMNSLGMSSGKLKGMLASAFAGIGLVTAVKDAVTTIAGFKSEMATLAAVTNASATSMSAFEKQARLLGATTEFSAKQAAEGMTFLARAGFNTEDVMASISGTLDLATAGAIGLGEAADIASNVLSQFNLAAEETGRVGDILVNTANSSNTNILQLAEAMKMAGPVAGALGQSLEEVSAAVGVLGDSGVQASLAGTNLRGAMSALLSPTASASKAIEGMGISMGDLDPATNSLTDIFKKFAGANLDAGDAVDIFGRRNAAAALIMAAGVEKMESLTDANKDAEDAAKKAAETMRNTLANSFKTLRSTIEEAYVTMGDKGLTGAVRGFTDTTTDAIRILLGMNTTTGDVTAAAKALASGIRGMTTAMVAFIALKSIVAIGSLFTGVKSLTGAMASLKLVMVNHPIMAIAAVVGAATIAVAAFVGTTDKATIHLENMKLTFGGLDNEMEKFAELQDKIDKSKMFSRPSEEARALKEQVGVLENILVDLTKGAEKKDGEGFVNFFDLEAIGVSMEDFRANLSSLSSETQDAAKKIGEDGRVGILAYSDAIKLVEAELEQLNETAAETILASGGAEDDIQTRVAQAIAIKESREALDEQIQSLRDEREILKASDEYAEKILARRSAEKETINLTTEERKKYLDTIEEEIRLNQEIKSDQKARAQALKDEKIAIENKNDAKQSIVDYVEALKTERETIKMSANDRELYNAAIETEKTLKDAGVTNTGKYIDAVTQEVAALQQARDAEERLQSERRRIAAENERIAQMWAQPFTDAVGDIVMGAETVKDSLRNLFKSISDMAVQQMFLKPLQNMMAGMMTPSTGGGGSGLASAFGFSAKGNAFANSGIVPFASGGMFSGFSGLLSGMMGGGGGGLGGMMKSRASFGMQSQMGGAWGLLGQKAVGDITDTPTLFGFANGGKIGVMGERGPEAILPLERDRSGKLGVVSQGGGGGGNNVSNVMNRSVNVSMNVSARDSNSFRKSSSQIAADLKFMTSGM